MIGPSVSHDTVSRKLGSGGMGVVYEAEDAGLKDADWARRDPDLALLHGDPEFERLFPATA